MKAATKSPASTSARSNVHGLTLAQQSAVDLLAAGKNDTETAAALNLNRVSVTRWRLYSPEFRAALADQRAAIWGAAADRLRSLLPKAINTLADALENGNDKVTVALAVLKLAGPLPLVQTDPTEADDYVRQQVERERACERKREQIAFADRIAGLPKLDDHITTVRERLGDLASGPGDCFHSD